MYDCEIHSLYIYIVVIFFYVNYIITGFTLQCLISKGSCVTYAFKIVV